MKLLLAELKTRLQALEPSAELSFDWALPPDRQMGDIAVPCFRAAKATGRKPNEVATAWSRQLEAAGFGPDSFIERTQAVGPYLNVFFNVRKAYGFLYELLTQNLAQFGGSTVGVGKNLVIDFSSPNIAKEMALHHLRSTGIGNALARLATKHGYNVTRLNYLGDWGTSHGKNLLGLKMFGSEEALLKEGLPYLLGIYVRFNQEEKTNPELTAQAKAAFAKLEQGDPESLRVWRLFRETSVREYEKLYRRLGVEFDCYDGESLYNDRLGQVCEEVNTVIPTRISEGALIYDLPNHKTPVLLKKDDGASLYITRDLAAIQDRFDRFRFDLAWYVVDQRQALHFKQLFDTVQVLGKEYAGRAEHVPFGLLLFGSQVMASRGGNIIFLGDVLNEAKARAAKIIQEKNPELKNPEETAEMIGIGAVLFADLSQNRTHDVKFEWDRALSFEGDTAPFIQYSHARSISLQERANEKLAGLGARNLSVQDALRAPVTDDLLAATVVHDFLGELLYFELYSERALKDRDPSQIAAATLRVAKGMNRLYHEIRFLSEEDPARLRLLIGLTEMCEKAVFEGLRLLGIRAPREM